MGKVKAAGIVSGDKGIDVSHYQTVKDWGAVASSGVKFVYIKATEGSEAGSRIVDPKMNSHFKGAKSVGLERGFYHFARYINVDDAIEEAKWFVKNIQNYDFTLPPCLDLEYNGCPSIAVLNKATVAFLNYVEEQLGSAIIYLNTEFYKGVKYSIKDYGIWFAYPSKTLKFDRPLSDLFAWQYNWHGSVRGIKGEVDLDIAGGNFFTVTNKKLKLSTPANTDAEPDKKPASPSTAKGVVEVVVDSLNLRNKPSNSGKRLRILKKGDRYKFYAIQDGWYNLGKDQWAYGGNGSYLKEIDPSAPSSPKKSIPSTYKVQAGDTLSSISTKFGVSVAQLQRLNGIKNPNKIYVGQTLRLK